MPHSACYVRTYFISGAVPVPLIKVLVSTVYWASGAFEHLVSFIVFAFLQYIVMYIPNLCKFVFEWLNKWPSNVIAGDICRVCRCEGSADKPLFHPCICTGSIKFIHQECLVQWLRYPLHTYRTSSLLIKYTVAVRSWYQCFGSGSILDPDSIRSVNPDP